MMSNRAVPRRPPYIHLLIAAVLAAASAAAMPATGAAPASAAPAPAAAAAGPSSSGPYDIERYLNIRNAGLAGLSPDASAVAFTTNVTGSNQIWTVPAAGGWPEQITFFSDRVAGVEWSSRGDRIAFSRDAGGDENFQIWIVSPDGADLTALTSDPEVRHNFGEWSQDGRLISYASNERNRKYFDVYVMDVESRRRRRVVEKDALFAAGIFSPDGKKLLVSRENGSLHNDLFLVDLSGGLEGGPVEPVHLTPHEGIVAFEAAGWSADGKIWVVSDSGREFFGLGRLDPAAKAITWDREPKWDVSTASVSRDGRTVAYVTNEDGYGVLGLIDAATMKDLPPIPLPRGVVGSPRFSRDGRTLAFSLIGPDRNSDVWLADLGTGRARQVTRSSTAGIPPSTFVVPEVVRYRSFDGLEIPAFLYLPRATGAAGKPPCIVNPHGGPEGQWTARFSGVIQYYVNRGYAVLGPNVRGSTGYGKTFTHLDDVRKREDSVKDMIAGVEWLKASGRIDPSRIAVMGGSYGGYMTLAAITLYPDLWAAAVDSFGIANFRTFFGKTASYRVSMRSGEYGDPEKDAEFLDAISPLHKVDRIKAPLLVLQGANDPRVPQHEAEQIVEAVRKKGGVVEYVLFPDEGHGWSKLSNQIKAHRATADFLDKHLKGGRADAGGD